VSRTADRGRRTAVWILVTALAAAGCGKKGDPQPPLPRGPNAVSDLSAEQVDLAFSEDAIREIARDAERVNRSLENIGARRLHTIMERLLEEISFAGPENAGRTISIEIDDVRAALADLVKDEDLSRYVL
jgi:hypothetical protein